MAPTFFDPKRSLRNAGIVANPPPYMVKTVRMQSRNGHHAPACARRGISTKRTIAPKLEGVRLGDRWAVIFSPYDLSCALEKQNSLECTGYGRDDAEKIALNVLLYSLNH